MKKYRYVGLLLAVVMSVFVFSGTAFAVPDENTQWLMELIDRSVDPAEKAVRAVEEYHLEAAQIRDFIETDTFYY